MEKSQESNQQVCFHVGFCVFGLGTLFVAIKNNFSACVGIGLGLTVSFHMMTSVFIPACLAWLDLSSESHIVHVKRVNLR